MKNVLFTSVAIMFAAISTPSVAQTEEGPQVDFYIGAQAGYHGITANPLGDDGGAIFGGYVGVDYGDRVIVGIEANLNAGTGLINSEYGVAAKLGIRTGETGQIFVRAGYQQVDFNADRLIDTDDLFGFPLPSIVVSDGDYLLGIGGQFMVADNISFRGVVDTVAFDSVRGTVGVAFHF